MQRVFLLLSVLFLLTSCSTNQTVEKVESKEETELSAEVLVIEEPLQIYTSIYALEDFIQKIGGDAVNVTNIIPAGADAHTYDPTIKTLTRIADADAFIYSGGGMEGFVERLIESMAEENVFMVEASEGIEFVEGSQHQHSHSHGHNHEHSNDHSHSHNHSNENNHHYHYDPHIFIDPIRSIDVANNVKNALAELLPEKEEDFQANFDNLKRELEILDQEFQEIVEGASTSTFLVAHAGYTYWADRYELEQVSITGFSPTNEPSIQQLQQLLDFATEHRISHVVFEKNYSIPIADMFIDELGAERLYFYNLEALTEEQREEGKDYFYMMRENIETMKIALNNQT
ncbi:metal ABC transporter solute-binding protein, Zn/Mn family [Anaerobacillus sp. MEB173]|uniref:metal ABC transporter solute-binding protein, Zn/Mn family n=1 Tax=Anaerobacillus sp. MEB173 TaxID=3383345 RepID=UPI003F8E71D3